MVRLLALAAAALAGLANGLPVNEDVNVLQPRDFCLLETLVVGILKLDSKADAFCTSALGIQTSTKIVSATSTPAVTTTTATAYTTGTETVTATETVVVVVSDYFTATEVDFTTVPVTEVIDVTETVSTVITVDVTDTATITDVSTATVTEIVPSTVVSFVASTTTDIIYDRRRSEEQKRGLAIVTPSCLQKQSKAFITNACNCLHLTTPTVTTTTTIVAATPTVTVTTTLPVTTTQTASVSVTTSVTTDITNTDTVTSTVPSTVLATSYFTTVDSSTTTDYATVDVTIDQTVTQTVTSTSAVVIVSTTQAVVTATQHCTTLAISKFSLGDTDQTTVAQANLYSGSNIVVNTNALFGPFTNPFPSTDSWSTTTPSLSLLYTCDNEWRVFIRYKNAGTSTIFPGAQSLSANTWSVSSLTPVGGATIQIYAVVWGIGLITDTVVINSLYNCQGSGTRFSWSNAFMHSDTWVGMQKTGAIYYTDASGTMKVLYGREGNYGQFS
ncbi:hypothetical protein N7541_003086 [Penicillium brevicompactum]|uniref:Uncharacterized protein n=1 Tax=Penicillium brevicompactum TaxID=5074 RepID=A0A9W9RL51_PENBR|nr:hypothetical protein N7541_003086 [Penicillium brevicompactum]